jgi:glycosyltransferase involved in cell wall biosynthesis
MYKCRLLLWSPQGAGLHYSGAGKNAYRLYQHFDHDRFAISLAHGYPAQERLDLFEEQYFIADGIKNSPFKLMDFLRSAKRWLEANAERFDVMHVVGVYEASMRPAAYAKALGLTVYVKVPNSGTGFMNSGRLSTFFKLAKKRLQIAKQLDGLISISNTIRNELLELDIDPSKIISIPNGVDAECFKPESKEGKRRLRSDLRLKDQFTVLFVGEIVPRKQPHLILKALELSARLQESVQFVFVGPVNDVDYGESFLASVNKISGKASVQWVDFSSKPEDYYGAADVFVLPSSNEGMSNAILEAMASGLPIISTNVSGNDELVQHRKNGLLLEDENIPKQLVDILLMLSSDEERAIEFGQQSRSMIMKKFTLTKVAESYMNVFSKFGR